MREPPATDPTLDAPVGSLTGTVLTRGVPFHGLNIHGRLGSGGMGVAWLASHPVLRVPLVVKTFHQNLEPALFHEARMAARVSSPHVVPALDAGVETGIPFVVQRYVDGIDAAELTNRLRSAGRTIPLAAVVRLVADVARGLHAIHQAGVVHRDVKPANLFLGGAGEAAIGDFGVALDGPGDSGAPVAGTPAFMAPEQWTGEAVGRPTDLYALGASAHLLATGEPPFTAPDLAGQRAAHLGRRYRPPPAADPRAAFFFSLVERLLRKRPEERHPHAEAVARELAVIAQPPPRVVPAHTWTARIGALIVKLRVEDLARSEADVVVNAANGDLTMRMGVAEALRRAGGDAIEAEATARAPCAMGDVVWTGPGALRARWVAHAVSAMDGAICLARCMLRVLLEADARGAKVVACPALGTGVGQVPTELAGKLLLEAVRTFAALAPAHVREVRFCLLEGGARERWRDILLSM